MFQGKKIILGITGSIAAYKAAALLRLLVKQGAEVQVIMTPAARDFITPLTLSTLSKKPVLVDLFKNDAWENHALLGRWAHLMLIAPLSCNTLSKMATGACDNLLMSVYLSATCPVMVAPAMDEDMWHHPATRHNIERIKSYGNIVIPVESGELASGLVGPGRMSEPEDIVSYARTFLNSQQRLKGKRVLVAAGPTYEHIDPVRFIGNHSSGKMGVALARRFKEEGADVTLVLGPVTQSFDLTGFAVKSVTSASQMQEVCNSSFAEADIAVMAAAVADYTPVQVVEEKIKKSDEQWSLALTKTPDILKGLGQQKRKGQVLVGFALETSNEELNAKGKLENKNADIIVLNSLRDEAAGFGKDTNKVTIFDRKGNRTEYQAKHKDQVAKDIVDYILSYSHA